MGYHYIIHMTPNISEKSIKYATVCQNLKWIRSYKYCRVEYLGSSGGDIDDITEDLLITGISQQVSNAKMFEKILSDFLPFLDFSNELEFSSYYDTPFVSFSQVNTEDLKSYYSELEGKIDVDWFFESDNEVLNLYNDVKKIYYDYHLESLLDIGLREEYEKFMDRTVSKTPFRSEAMERIDSKAKLLGTYFKFPLKRMEGNNIIYGKYHVSNLNSEIEIPKYALNTTNVHTHILDYAFAGCDNLISIKIWDEVSYFGEFAFLDCVKLKRAQLNPNMKAIPRNIFVNCKSLEIVDIPSTVKVIGEHAFNGCQSLNDVNLFSNTCLENIENSAFFNCSNLKSIRLPETLLSIGDYVFADSGLEWITIPSNVKSIGFGTFSGCTKLKSVIFTGPILELPYSCFSECNELESVTLPTGIVEIGDSAFSDCQKLKQLVIPNGVQKIGDDAFRNCKGLTEIVFPKSIIKMGSCDFDKSTIIYCCENSLIHKLAINEEWNFQLI